jgi:hypothetical protein
VRREVLPGHDRKDDVTVPRFPEFKPVGLEDRAVISRWIETFPTPVCEMNFANILIWKESERPRCSILDGNLCLLIEPTFEPAYFLPPLGPDVTEATLAALLDMAPRLSRIPRGFVDRLPAGLRAQEDRDNFDYVYLTADLAELRGKKFDGKRNRIRKFEAEYPGRRYEILGPEHLAGCRRLLDAWFGEKACPSPHMEAERLAILEALAWHSELELRGAVVMIDGRPEAFTMGTPLTGDTVLIQIEIANPEISGLAQWINREFVRREWSSFRFINREQDLGVPGLRRAKMSYQPDHLVRKYELSAA